MTWTDPIVDEVRRARDAYAARFNHDLRAIFRDLKQQEMRSGRKLVSYAADATGSSPDRATQPAALVKPITGSSDAPQTTSNTQK